MQQCLHLQPSSYMKLKPHTLMYMLTVKGDASGCPDAADPPSAGLWCNRLGGRAMGAMTKPKPLSEAHMRRPVSPPGWEGSGRWGCTGRYTGNTAEHLAYETCQGSEANTILARHIHTEPSHRLVQASMVIITRASGRIGLAGFTTHEHCR